MSGSALPALGSSTWNRGVIGSVVSGSEEWRASTSYSDYLFKISSSFFRSGEVRYLRLSSNSQTIEDSYVPDIVEICKRGSASSSGSFVWFPIWGVGTILSTDGSSLTGSDNANVSNNEWKLSFPFEKKYDKIAPDLYNLGSVIKLKTKYTYTLNDPNVFFAETVERNITKRSFFAVEATVLSGGFFKRLVNNYNEIGYVLPNGNWGGLSPLYSLYGDTKTTNAIFFGINPSRILEYSSYADGSGSNYLVTNSVGATAEGWKYGLYNATPTNFSAVFRQNHYGQFRDMLEQRIYTATYNNPQIGGPMDANGGIKFISGSALAGERDDYAIAKIYNSQSLNVAEAYRVNPYGSGIFDTLYRASQPWHADDTRITVRGGV